MAAVLIDEMRLADVEGACALFHSIPELGLSPSFDAPQRIASFVERNSGFSTVARADNHLIGAVLCGHDGRRAFFYHTGVHPSYRRLQIARQMVERSMERLRQAGLTSAFCFTWDTSSTAQAFWRSVGFDHSANVQYRFRDL